MSVLKPYDEDNTCPKCGMYGMDEITTRYCQGVNLSANKSCTLLYQTTHPNYDSHMERCCSRCGFSWAEQPLDSEEATRE